MMPCRSPRRSPIPKALNAIRRPCSPTNPALMAQTACFVSAPTGRTSADLRCCKSTMAWRHLSARHRIPSRAAPRRHDLTARFALCPPCQISRCRIAPMIPRYARPEMSAIWEAETRFRIWFEIEAYSCDALVEIGVIPKEAARAIWEKGGRAAFDSARIEEIEKTTQHDVIAFLTHLAEL